MSKVLENIIDLYSRRNGVNPTALIYQVWEIALADRMQKTNLLQEWDYYQKWINSPTEMQHFFDRIVVLETWFFRDIAAFNYLASYAFNEWYPRNKEKGALRLLSIPCSTGEEPYSMAISLIRAGFPSRMFSIDAVDISPSAIAKAELGIYGKNSFRTKEIEDLSYYFDVIEEGQKIKAKVHEQVNFRIGNVFDHGFASGNLKYDVIFCRNLLIYLQPEAQNNLLRIINRLLSPQGVVFTGATEGELFRKFGFFPTAVPKSLSFYNSKFQPKSTLRSIRHEQVPLPVVNVQESRDVFQKAKEYADQGQFDEAISECLNLLQDNGPSPEGYFLLGVIMHASTRYERSAEFFKKALYLNPDYYEALTYMVLLAEASGSHEESQRYRERLARLVRTKAVKG